MNSRSRTWLSLYRTEGKRFCLSGQVWLGGPYEEWNRPFPTDFPHGFAVWLREWDSLRRYAANTRGLRVKRRLHEGKHEEGITWPVRFDSFETERWYSFYIEAARDFIYFRKGSKSGIIKGPLAVDGANKIAIVPGTKLRNLRLQVGEKLEKPRIARDLSKKTKSRGSEIKLRDSDSANDLTKRKRIQIEEAKVLLRETLPRAKTAQKEGRWVDAAYLYEEALQHAKSIDGDVESKQREVITGLVETRLVLAKKGKKVTCTKPRTRSSVP